MAESAAFRPGGGEESGSNFSIVSYLTDFLGAKEPAFLLITGPVGSGKSTMLRALVPQMKGAKLFLAFHVAGGTAGAQDTSAGRGPQVSVLIADPQLDDRAASTTPTASDGTALLAFSPQDPESDSGMPPLLGEALARLSSHAPGYIISDSWDRATEAFYRMQVADAGSIRTFTAPERALMALQSAIISSPSRIVVCTDPQSAAPLSSIADAVVELHWEELAGERVRVVTFVKVRGNPPPMREYLYSLSGGRFHFLPGLPPGFLPPAGLPEPDPGPDGASGWPGSAAYAQAFGRLRFGGLSVLTASPHCPDTIPDALATPIALHALRSGGRVVWIPAPSVRSSRIIQLARELLPTELIRERLRIITASQGDPALGELQSVVLPLVREKPAPSEPSAVARPSPGPLFEGVYEFLRGRADTAPVIHIVSSEGLRAACAAAGFTPEVGTLATLIGFYTRLPHYHMFAYASADDPVVPHVRPAADTLLHLEMLHGRPVLFGVRPSTPPFVLDWSDRAGPYSLVPLV